MNNINQLAGIILSAVSLTVSPVALSSERNHHEQREHGAHEHGSATLNIAIEENSLHIELESPAMNIVGFEHAASNEKQNTTVTQATQALKEAPKQFVLPAAAQCILAEAHVESPLLNNQHNKKKHAEKHSEFHASYIFNCKNVSALNTINVRLFETFKGMNDIDVQLISSQGQTTKELTKNRPILVIKP
ncbi:MAG: DUF2796 domain-containing protein [Gammaproteobacteria bacterium]|nr:DUF2796 domain-containing protein [Gammaproteobacteria bacterium]